MRWCSQMFMILLAVSCTSINSKENPQDKTKKEGYSVDIIEKFLHKGMSLGEVKKILGNPDEVFRIPNIPYDIHAYNNKRTKFKEWSFAVDKSGEVASLNYEPGSDPLLDRMEVLPQTWKKYHCKKKRKLERTKHAVGEVTFFECAKGKIRAYYNIHGEVSTIVVER